MHRANANPLDLAILAYDHQGNLGHPDVKEYEKLDEIPFDFERRRVSIVVGNAGKRLLITKGAPESILPLCVSYESNGKILPLDAKEKCEDTYRDLSTQGFRVLAVAYRNAPVQDAYRVVDEKESGFRNAPRRFG